MSRLVRFDKVAMGEVTINFLGPTVQLIAKAKLVSTTTGDSFGSMTLQHWSPATIAKLGELRSQMELDAERMVFEDSPTGEQQNKSREFLSGIGEHLDDDIAPGL